MWLTSTGDFYQEIIRSLYVVQNKCFLFIRRTVSHILSHVYIVLKKLKKSYSFHSPKTFFSQKGIFVEDIAYLKKEKEINMHKSNIPQFYYRILMKWF